MSASAYMLMSCGGKESPTRETTFDGNDPPVAVISIVPASAPVDSTFTFEASGCSDKEDPVTAHEVHWDLDDNATLEISWTTQKACHKTFAEPGRYAIRLQGRDTAQAVTDTTDILVVTGASFTVSPAIGYLTTDFVFDASLSSDVNGRRIGVECRWDFEGDGNWDIAWGPETVIHHQYTEIGELTPILEVRGSDGIATSARHSISVYYGTGILEWEFSLVDFAVSHPGLGADGAIYVESGNSSIYAVNPDGSERWQYLTGLNITTAPAVSDDGRVYVFRRWESVCPEYR